MGGNAMKHIVITGTGRAGTSFLVQLFTEMGLDTGYRPGVALHPVSRAGLEHDLRGDGPFPRIVKDPAFMYYADRVLNKVERVIIPVRQLEAAAESRRKIYRINQAIDPDVPTHGGGLFGMNEPALQEAVLAMAQYRMIHLLVSHGIPFEFICYESMMGKDGEQYLYDWYQTSAVWYEERGTSLNGLRSAYRKVFNADWYSKTGK